MVGQRPKLDLKALRGETCTQRVLSADEYYAAFKRMGIDYGPAHKGIEKLYAGKNEVLAKLKLPSSIADTKDQFTLHPSLLASTLQASIGLDFTNQQLTTESKKQPFLPVALERLEILDRCTESMWAWVQSYQGNPSLKLAIDLCNDLGDVCVRMKAVEMQTYLEAFTENSTQEQEALARKEMDKEVQEKNEPSNVEASAYTLKQLTSIVADTTKIPKVKIDVDADLEELGLDSIMIATLNQQVEKWLGKLDATLFFKYKTLSSLAKFLSEAYSDTVVEDQRKEVHVLLSNGMVEQKDLPSLKGARSVKRYSRRERSNQDIAIIGMSGRYPQANNDLIAFWELLRQGQDGITEIPKERFDYHRYFNEEKGRADSLYCKWGGFIDSVDQSDPLFFNISPQDARFMDPQERLFLEMAWVCLETAGYIRPHWQQVSVMMVKHKAIRCRTLYHSRKRLKLRWPKPVFLLRVSAMLRRTEPGRL